MNEGLQALHIAQRQSQARQRLAECCRLGPLRRFAGGEEMIQQSLAVSKSPAERFKLGGRKGQQG